jgi:transcriptional regulator with XRE-family HTH domain
VENRQINKGGRPKRQVSVNGSTLTEARIFAGLSLGDVARRLGVCRSTISRWERNQQVPPPEAILKMLAMYKTDHAVIKVGGGDDGK